MMNKSAIDWCDFTWNPVTGCLRGCPYCYAKKQARRFCGDIRMNLTSEQLQKEGDRCYILERPFKTEYGTVLPYPAGFAPTIHRYRLPMPAQKQKPANIFVCSMADLFAKETPTRWVVDVLDAARAATWHNYLFLTKSPERYRELDALALLPHTENFWYGTSINTQADIGRLAKLPAEAKRFVSIEPIMGPIDLDASPMRPHWVIIGAETGNRVGKCRPAATWINDIIAWGATHNGPVHVKDSDELRDATGTWGHQLLQQFPTPLIHVEKIIPHCRDCEHASFIQQGKRGKLYSCDKVQEDGGPTHIPGRYTRTSPPWCPKRSEGEKL